jgi:hypothetical protein
MRIRLLSIWAVTLLTAGLVFGASVAPASAASIGASAKPAVETDAASPIETVGRRHWRRGHGPRFGIYFGGPRHYGYYGYRDYDWDDDYYYPRRYRYYGHYYPRRFHRRHYRRYGHYRPHRHYGHHRRFRRH